MASGVIYLLNFSEPQSTNSRRLLTALDFWSVPDLLGILKNRISFGIFAICNETPISFFCIVSHLASFVAPTSSLQLTSSKFLLYYTTE